MPKVKNTPTDSQVTISGYLYENVRNSRTLTMTKRMRTMIEFTDKSRYTRRHITAKREYGF